MSKSQSEKETLLKQHRRDIDALDREIIALLGKRYDIVRDVARIKVKNDIPVIIPERIEEVLDHVARLAQSQNMPGAYARTLYKHIIDEACRLEDNFIKEQEQS